MSVDVGTQPHPASRQAAVAHTTSSHCQIKHQVDNVIDLKFLPLHCSVNKGKRCVPWVVLCNVPVYFFFLPVMDHYLLENFRGSQLVPLLFYFHMKMYFIARYDKAVCYCSEYVFNHAVPWMFSTCRVFVHIHMQ